jgi:hypothetical protein
LSGAAPALSDKPPLWRALASAISLRNVAAAEMFGLLVTAYECYSDLPLSVQTLRTYLIIDGIGAPLVLIAALATDEAVRRGIRLRYAFSVALLLASLCTALAQWNVRLWLGSLKFPPDSGPVLPRILSTASEIAVIGGLAMIVYLHRQSSQRLLLGLRSAELQRARAENRLVEARLAMTYAQIDGDAVLQSLAAIRDQFAAVRPEAEVTLEVFIQDLRASLIRSQVAATARVGPTP